MTQLYVHHRQCGLLALVCTFLLSVLVGGCGAPWTGVAATPLPTATPDQRVPVMETRIAVAEQQAVAAETAAAEGGRHAATAEASAATALAQIARIPTELVATPAALVSMGSAVKLTYTDTSGAPRTLLAPLVGVSREGFSNLAPDRLLVLATQPDPADPNKNRTVIYYTAAALPGINASAGPGTWELLQANAPINLSSDGSAADGRRVLIRGAKSVLTGPFVQLIVPAGSTVDTMLIANNLFDGFWLLIPEGKAEDPRYHAYIVFNVPPPPSDEDPLGSIACLACYVGICWSSC
jgi:hypothetical protein